MQFNKPQKAWLPTKVVNILIPTKVGRKFYLLHIHLGIEIIHAKNKAMETQSINSVTPSAGGSFSFGWRKMFEKNFLTLFIAVIITGILSGPIEASFKWDDGDFNFVLGAWAVLLIILAIAWEFLVAPIISYGERYLFLKAMRDEELDIKTLFEGFRNQYADIVLTHLVIFALVGIGLVMLIIPGIIIACRLAFAPYIVMDQKMEPMEAIEESWRMTRGHGWTVFFMAIITFFLIIVGLMACIVGVLVSLMWMHAAFATLYQSVLNQKLKDSTIPIIDTYTEE